MATTEEYEAFVKKMKGSTEQALAAQELKAVGATA
jgi:hypothetical protein